MKTAIIGGGMAGLGAAYELVLAGMGGEVTIFEKSPYLGGLASVLKIGGVPIEHYYHHLFPTYHDFWEVAKKLGFYNTVYFKKARTATYYDGVLYPFTEALDLLRFTPLQLSDRVRMGLFALYCKTKRDWRSFEKSTAKEWLLKYLGEKCYQVVWKPLLESKFGTHADSISMTWLWGRIFERPSEFGYFEGGFLTFIHHVSLYLEKEGTSIRTSCAIHSIEKSNSSFSIATDSGAELFDRVIVAAPPEVFGTIAGELLPADFRNSLEQFPYMGSICVLLSLRKKLTEYYWINVNDEHSPFVAVVEQTNFVPEGVYGGLHPVYLSRYIAVEDPLYQSEDDEIIKTFLTYLGEMIPSFSLENVKECRVFKAPYTQPVMTLGYEMRKPQYHTPVPGLWWVSMSHVYPWDRGTDHSFRAGRELIRAMLRES
jgi:protoporphyrinogen oxidase